MKSREKSTLTTGRLIYSNSGQKIEFIQGDEGVFVRKHFTSWDDHRDFHYHRRLLKHGSHSYLKNDFIVPKILADTGKYYDIEYISGIPVIECLSSWSKAQVDKFIEAVLAWFFHHLRRPIDTWGVSNLFLTKLRSLEKYLPWYISLNLKLMARRHDNISNSFCHGDFTMSNILWLPDSGKFALIDSHDVFFHSIMQDIVKLRQDTIYGWSLSQMQEIRTVDEKKIRTVLKYIDKKVMTYICGEYDWIKKDYRYFQAFNLARLLPYSDGDTQKKVIQWLKTLLFRRTTP